MEFTKTNTTTEKKDTLTGWTGYIPQAKNYPGYQNVNIMTDILSSGFPTYTAEGGMFPSDFTTIYLSLINIEKHYRDLNNIFGTLRSQMKELHDFEKYIKLQTVEVNEIPSRRWKLNKPLKITIEQRSQDDFTACLYEADIFGYGDSIPSSIENLQISLVNQYEFLLEQRKKYSLGGLPSKQLEILSKVLKRTIK